MGLAGASRKPGPPSNGIDQEVRYFLVRTAFVQSGKNEGKLLKLNRECENENDKLFGDSF